MVGWLVWTRLQLAMELVTLVSSDEDDIFIG